MNTLCSALIITTIALMPTSVAEPAKPAGAPSTQDYSYLKILEQPTRPLDTKLKLLIEEIKRAIEAEPKNANHYFNLAVTYALLLHPDIPAARTAYKTALELAAMHDKQLDELLKTK